MSTIDFAKAMSLSSEELEALLAGRSRISVGMARGLNQILGGTVGFWITRDGQFREDVARLEAHRAVATLPVSDMVTYGWIQRPADWLARIDAVFGFFDVSNLDAWRAKYLRMISGVRLRASNSRPPTEGSLAVWMRQAEKQAHELNCQPWDSSNFRDVLENVKALTRVRNPVKFIPELQRLCASVGVAVVVVRAPSGCAISGAARFLADDLGLIGLTARHLTNDHLWFTFFHEAAHLLLHPSRDAFVDELSVTTSDPTEREADDFAAGILLSESGRQNVQMVSLDMQSIIRLAHDLRIAPGIVVGQLQFQQRLGFGSSLNHLKRRFRWTGASLEMA
jgi:plasmid maintenance system antidote protein VapI